MLLGIDVGGTFTDAVVLREGAVVAQAKRATLLVCAGRAGCGAAAGNGAGAGTCGNIQHYRDQRFDREQPATGVFGNYCRTGHERQGTSAGNAVLFVGLCGPSRQDYG